MVYQTGDILRDIRIALDENRDGGALLDEGDADTLSVDELSLSKIEEAVRSVIVSAPPALLDGGRPFGETIFWGDKPERGPERYMGWTLLPEDFLRLVVWKMSDWERAVYEAIGAGDAGYGALHSRYSGLRGTPQKPVVAIVTRPEGRALELYSCRSRESTVEQGVYIPRPRIDRAGGIEIPERCYRGAVYEAAARVAHTTGRSELGNILRELSKETIG